MSKERKQIKYYADIHINDNYCFIDKELIIKNYEDNNFKRYVYARIYLKGYIIDDLINIISDYAKDRTMQVIRVNDYNDFLIYTIDMIYDNKDIIKK